ncbi:hypothetical protein J6590_037714 [Homalodisca vitripennis]|nr:hypothetical protein J6590_037714 [Homalodisca vitripennis]
MSVFSDRIINIRKVNLVGPRHFSEKPVNRAHQHSKRSRVQIPGRSDHERNNSQSDLNKPA